MRWHALFPLTTLLVLLPVTMVSAELEVAARGEGHLGYVKIDILSDFDGLTGGGSGSIAAIFDHFYFQADVFGDAMDYDDIGDVSSIGPGVHAGWFDPEFGSIGVIGTYTKIDTDGPGIDVYRAGLETELYLDFLSLGLNAGYLDLSGSNAYVEGVIAAYPVERARLKFRMGGVGIQESNPLVNLGLGGQYLFGDVVAPFVRWEASVSDDLGDVIQYSVVGGVALYWGADTPTLEAYDRGYLKPGCDGVQFLGRFC